jgi:hypothetical protein
MLYWQSTKSQGALDLLNSRVQANLSFFTLKLDSNLCRCFRKELSLVTSMGYGDWHLESRSDASVANQ